MHLTPWIVAAALFALAPLFLFGLAGERCSTAIAKLPVAVRLFLPALFAMPYLLVCGPLHLLRLSWLLLYLILPVAVTTLLALAAKLDPQQRGHWLDFELHVVCAQMRDGFVEVFDFQGERSAIRARMPVWRATTERERAAANVVFRPLHPAGFAERNR